MPFRSPSPLRHFIEQTVEVVVVRALARLEKTLVDQVEAIVDRRLARELGVTGSKATKLQLVGSRARAAPRGDKRRKRVRGEMTKWIADRRARRVPLFVIEATGLDTKTKIVKRFGENASFEKGKPLPKAA
jgi:hypothetical protein